MASDSTKSFEVPAMGSKEFPNSPVRDITKNELREYQECGVVCLSGLFHEAWKNRMRNAMQEIIDDPSRVLGRQVTKSSFIGDQNVWKLLDDFRDFVYLSPAASIASAFLGSKYVRLFQDHLFIKPAACKVPTPWHHDHTFFPIKGGPLCSIWMALSEIDTANGGMEFVSGSHKWPQRFKAVRPDALHYFQESDFEDVPDVDSNRDSYEIVRWKMEPGDVLVFDSLTLHAAGTNETHMPRNAYATRWFGEGLFYDPRHATARLRWQHGLQPGDHLSGTLFPQILPAPIEEEFGIRRLGPEQPDPDLTRLNREAYADAEARKLSAAIKTSFNR